MGMPKLSHIKDFILGKTLYTDEVDKQVFEVLVFMREAEKLLEKLPISLSVRGIRETKRIRLRTERKKVYKWEKLSKLTASERDSLFVPDTFTPRKKVKIPAELAVFERQVILSPKRVICDE